MERLEHPLMVPSESSASPKYAQPAAGTWRGDPLQDRIREGLTGSVAEQVAIALLLTRLMSDLHARGQCCGTLSSRSVYLDAQDQVSLFPICPSSESLQAKDIRGLGVVLFELV